MVNKNLSYDVALTNDGKILRESAGEILRFASDSLTISLENLQHILEYPIVKPLYRISVLHEDETVDYIIPSSDIVDEGISYTENYSNGQRRNISLKLVNVSEPKITATKEWENLTNEEKIFWKSKKLYYLNNTDHYFKYAPSVDRLWYGKKIKYDIGLYWNGKPYYFNRGIYIIDGFDFSYTTSQREVTYQLKDKFCIYAGTTGTLDVGYEIPVDTPIEEVIPSIQNFSNTDGTVNDLKSCIIDTKYTGFKTQATIRVEAGGKLSEVYDQLATQMSAEYYYNSVGNLCFYPIDESLNEVDKPIIWQYTEIDLDGLNLNSEEDLVNVVKVTGDNVDGEIYSAIVKNENLNSPINIYYIKERMDAPIQNPNIWSDEMAEDLAKYNLRKKSILALKQTINVPFNPLLMVNNLVEIKNKDLNMDRQRFIINSISYTSNSPTMAIEVVNIDELPIIGQVTN